MARLTKQQVLDAQDRATKIVEVPEWGGEVVIMAMDGHSRDKWEISCAADSRGKQNLVNLRARLVALSVIDEDNNLMFSDADIVKLGRKSGVALDRVFAAAQKLQGVTDEEVEELAKN